MSLRNHARSLAAVAAALVAAIQPCAAARVEPGMEQAVKWKWSVDDGGGSTWGLPGRSVPVVRTAPSDPTPPAGYLSQGPVHTVRAGDSLYRIARKHKISVAQLMEFNGMDSHLINIGDRIRIPTSADLPKLKSTPPSAKAKEVAPSDVLRLRVHLDRLGFSTGPLDDEPGPHLGRVLHLYKSGPGASLDDEAIAEQARREVPEPLTTYTLREADFRFIAPPRATAVGASAEAPAYRDLVAADFLAYRTPWEFVAERYQVDEAFLRKINPGLPPYPAAGTQMLVPDVEAFEIEKVPAAPIQPAPSAGERVEAAVFGQSVLEIRRNGEVVATLPLATARPGLRGRGHWRILDAVTRPRMATIREPRFTPRQETSPFYVNPNPTPERRPATLPTPEFLPPGPNNPVGVVWINLTKDDNAGPLPFGLHGSSLPSKIRETESIGGFQMTNRDAFRTATLLPPGTRLEWKP